MRKGLSRAALALLLALMLAPTAAAQRGAATACDPFASKACLMPFPNDMNLTVRDTSTPTQRRVRLPRSALIRNKDGVTADPAEGPVAREGGVADIDRGAGIPEGTALG